MKKFGLSLALIFIYAALACGLWGFSSDEESIMFNDNYITVYFVGYWSKPEEGSYTKPETFNDIFRVRFEENDADYYFHESTVNLKKCGYTSVFPYLFSNGWEKDEYRINGQTPHAMSDVIVREIGDFNVGSQVMRNTRSYYSYKQCLLGVAKTEWVFSRYIARHNLTGMTPDWNDKNSSATKRYEELVQAFGPYLTLLSRQYIASRLPGSMNGGTFYSNLAYTRADGSRATVDEIARELYELAWLCPNRFNIVAHSMGGMHTMEYLNGDPNKAHMYGYDSVRKSSGESIYKFYQNYTKPKYAAEKENYANPNLFRSFELLSSLGLETYIANMSTAEIGDFIDMLKALDAGYWDRKIKQYDPALDLSTLSSGDANIRDLVLYLMFCKERENGVHKVTTEDSPLVGSYDPGIWTQLMNFIGDSSTFTGFVYSVVPCVFANLAVESLFLVSFIYDLVMTNGNVNIFEELFVIIPLVMLLDGLIAAFFPLELLFYPYLGYVVSYCVNSGTFLHDLHGFFSTKSDQLDELKNNSSLVQTYKHRTGPPDQMPYADEPVKIYTTSFSGVPTPAKDSFNPAMLYANLVMGHTQRVLIRVLMHEGYNYFGNMFGIDTGDYNRQHWMLTLLNSLLGCIDIQTTWNGSFLVPSSSSRGDGISWFGGTTNYHLDKSTADFARLERTFSGLARGVQCESPYDYAKWKDNVMTEVFALHQWAQNFLSVPIRAIDNDIVFFDKSPYKNSMSVTNSRGQRIGSFNNIACSTDPKRNLFSHIFLDQYDDMTTINNVSVPQKNEYGNNYQPSTSDLPLNRGLACNWIVAGNVGSKALDYLVVSNYLRVFPVKFFNYYDGMKTFVSINGSYFIEGQRVADIDQYALNHANDTLPTMVFNDRGHTNIVSPRLKEGFNTLTFKFIDVFGRSIIKDMVVMQNLIPPFLNPISPAMNEYVGSSAFTMKIQALDITQTKPVERWFAAQNCALEIDSAHVPLLDSYFDRNDFTINIPLSGLADGNHTVRFSVNAFGSVNERSFRFWVDTTPPVVSLPDATVISNADRGVLAGLGADVSDTVPFSYTAGGESHTYDVDTVVLSHVRATIDGTIGLYDKTNAKLGAHAFGWNGWDGDVRCLHGVHTLSVEAVDRLGNRSERSSELIIDNEAPVFDYARFNGSVINTKTGLLSLDYRFALDPWETTGKIGITFRNRTANEEFTMTTEGPGDMDNSYPITYVSGGANILKDGIYDIDVTAIDGIGNSSDAVSFRGVVVDMTPPVIDAAYTSPFVLANGNTLSKLTIKAHEKDEVVPNLSLSLSLSVSLENQYEETVSSFAPYSGTIPCGAGTLNDIDLTVPAGLAAGKYFFVISIGDRNGNVRREYAPFVVDAVSPEISSPAMYDLIDSSVTLLGSAGDPRWDNSLGFDHYELSYRLDDSIAPLDVDNLDDGWKSDCIRVPAFQASGASNIGRYPVEENGILGILDTTSLPDGLVTVLLVAVEEGGYRIGTARTFRIVHRGKAYNVDLAIDPQFTGRTVPVDFGADDLMVPYTVSNDYDNPVDLYTTIADSAGKVVFSSTGLDLQSSRINGAPNVGTADQGIFVWMEGERLHVLFVNGSSGDTMTTLVISSRKEFSNLAIDGTDPTDKGAVQLIENGTKIVAARQLAAGERMSFSVIPNSRDGMTFNALTDGVMTNIATGKDKFIVAGSGAMLFPGAEFPPVIWDGTDTWGRCVANGIYVLTIEAVGNKGGSDVERCTLDVKTPTVLTITSVSPRDKRIQPGIPGVDRYEVSAVIGKSCTDIRALVSDASGRTVRTITPTPSTIHERGNFIFAWNCDDDSGALCPNGTYSIALSCTLGDGSVFTGNAAGLPELGGIIITDVYNPDPLVPASFGTIGNDTFNARELVSGDTSYRVEVEPRGKHYPDKEIRLGVKAKGNQIVNAAPDIDYMAGIRVNYEELAAEVNYRARVNWSVRSVAKSFFDSKSDSSSGSTSSELKTETDIRLVSYRIDDESMDLHTKTISFVFSGSDGFTQPDDAWLPEPAPPFGIPVLIPCAYRVDSKSVSASLDANVVFGQFYTTLSPQCSVTSFTHSESGRSVNVYFTVVCTIVVSAKPDFTVRNYYSYCDGIAAMSPDLPDDPSCPYIHKTAYAYAGAPEIPYAVLLDVNNIYNSTNLPNDDVPAELRDPNQLYQSKVNVWRKNRRILFYGIGESAAGYRESCGTVKYEIDAGSNEYSEPKSDGHSLAARAGATVLDLSTMVDGDALSAGSGSVRFEVTKTAGVIGVSASTDSRETILVPFPILDGTIEYPHDIGDEAAGIPLTHVNRTRINADSVPNYHVADADVVFGATDMMLPAPFVYDRDVKAYAASFDFSAGSGFYGSVIGSVDQAYRDRVNIKEVLVSGWSACDSGTWDEPRGALAADDVSVPSDFQIPGVLSLVFAPALDDARFDWDLSLDPVAGSRVMTLDDRKLDSDTLDRYGKAGTLHVSSLYPESGVTSGTSMYSYDSGHTMRDNDRVIVMKDTAGEYIVRLESIDSREYRGLAVTGNDTALYTGNKLLDRFDIGITKESQRQLVRIAGTGAFDAAGTPSYTIGFFHPVKRVWLDIPVIGADQAADILTYWDITGLPTGLYTLRLASTVRNNGTSNINLAMKEVYIGKKYDGIAGATNDQVFDSPEGNCTVIFPAGSFGTDTLVSVTPVELVDIEDIAILPRIAPVGKVIMLSPEDARFVVPVTLRFVYNRDQLAGMDTNVLTIYNIASDGTLVPLNTMRRYIKVETDAAGNVTGESDGSVSDFTYVEIWSLLTHFSYYTVIEGIAASRPVIDQSDFSTNRTRIDLSGSYEPGAEIVLSCDDDPVFVENGEAPVPAGYATCDADGHYAFDDVELPFEGDNFFFLGSHSKSSGEVAKIRVTRDTTPPVLSIDRNALGISPNGDSVMESDSIAVASGEKGALRLTVSSPRGEQVFDRSVENEAGTPVVFSFTGRGKAGAWPDGDYEIVIRASDMLGNESRADDVTLTIDTTPVEAKLAPLARGISPSVEDGVNDSLELDVACDEQTSLSVRILDITGTVAALVADGIAAGTGHTRISWDGRDASGNRLKDGPGYRVQYETRDGFGNRKRWVSVDTFAIDNLAPDAAIAGGSTSFAKTGDRATIQLSVGEAVMISADVSFGDTVAQVLIANTTGSGRCVLVWDIPASAPFGTYVVTIGLTDIAGNTAVIGPWNISVNDDAKPPVTGYSWNGKTAVEGDRIVISPANLLVLTAEDGESGVASIRYTIDGGVEQTYTVPLSFAIEGEHTLVFRAGDIAGNESAETALAFVVDATGPVVEFSGVADAIYKYPVTPNVSVTDPHFDFVLVLQNGAAYTPGTTISNAGTYTLSVTAYDTVGNVSERSVIFVIDPDYMPVPEGVDFYFIDNDRDHGRANPHTVVTWYRITDIPDLAGYNCYVNGRKINHRPIGNNFVELRKAERRGFVIEVASVDRRGNESARTRNLDFSIDRRLLDREHYRKRECKDRPVRFFIGNEDYDTIVLEYSYLDDMIPVKWTALDRTIDVVRGGYAYTLDLPEHAKGKSLVVRAHATKNGRVFCDGESFTCRFR